MRFARDAQRLDRGALTVSNLGDGSSTNTLEAELAFDSERLALPKALRLLRNAELSCICIALWVRPNV